MTLPPRDLPGVGPPPDPTSPRPRMRSWGFLLALMLLMVAAAPHETTPASASASAATALDSAEPKPPPGHPASPPPRPLRVSPGAVGARSSNTAMATNAAGAVPSAAASHEAPSREAPREAPPAASSRPPRAPLAGNEEWSLGRVPQVSDLPFASSNLISNGADTRRAQAEDAANAEFTRKLETGRRFRASGLYSDAEANFAPILTTGAPEEFQRAALMELAQLAQDQNLLARTLQIYSQYLSRWPQDPAAPEILLRQGLIYRQLGLHQMATTKFYATMTAALSVKDHLFDYYKRLVLQAQAEIAETLALQNLHAEAAAAYARLMKEDSPLLNRVQVHYRYIQLLAAQGKFAETIGQARQFLTTCKDSAVEPEVRFLLASALKKLNRNSEAVREILDLLQLQQASAQEHPEALAYWQQRTGNEIANQLYQDGDFLHALEVYGSLLVLSPLPEWQCPIQYQMGLAYEHLQQPAKAAESYAAIVAQGSKLGTNAPPSLVAMLEMARWRQGTLTWQERAAARQREVGTLLVAPEPAASTTSTNRL